MTVSTKAVDLEAIVPENGELVVEGIPAVVKRLKAKEFLQLVRVLTIGLGPAVQHVDLSGGTEDEMQSRIVGLFIAAIPEAIDEFGEFLFNVVDAKDPKERAALRKAMEEPEIETMLDVITLIAIQEKDDIRSLAGKAKAALSRIQSVYRPTGK
jgi:hypothetical protein